MNGEAKMQWNLCSDCLVSGVCQTRTSLVVTDAELANNDFLRDARMFAVSRGIKADSWMKFLCNYYRDYNGRMLDRSGREAMLDFTSLEHPNIREWFKAWACKGPDPNKPVRLRREARERVRVVATILRSQYPVAAMHWGIRAANDNVPPHANDNVEE